MRADFERKIFFHEKRNTEADLPATQESLLRDVLTAEHL